MAGVKLTNINKVYENGFHAVKGADIDIADKEFMVLVGPSGCGKTTTLRMIAGLESITEGELHIDEKLVNDVQPKDRDIAMVFQNYALYPHMTVFDNMAFGLKLRKMPKDEIKKTVEEVAGILGIEDLLVRKPKQLSGGQRQRVALGRAIVRKPKVFLMDEPLSNLDAKLRVEMRAQLIKLHYNLETTFIYVTHDQTEAMTMGTRICVMNGGHIQQIASPAEVYNHPSNMFVASFIGSPQINFFDVELVNNNGKYSVKRDGYELELTPEQAKMVEGKGYDNKTVVLGCRPEDVLLGDAGMDTTVEVTELLGAETYVYYSIGDETRIAKCDKHASFKIGDKTKVSFVQDKIHLFDKETEKTIF